MITLASAKTLATLTVWRANVVHQREGCAATSIEWGMNVMAQPCPAPGQPFVDSHRVARKACQRGGHEFPAAVGVNVRTRRKMPERLSHTDTDGHSLTAAR